MSIPSALICAVSASWMLASFSAGATDGISCTGTVATIGVHGTDRVILRLSGMNEVVQICHLNQTMGATFPITAQAGAIRFQGTGQVLDLGELANSLSRHLGQAGGSERTARVQPAVLMRFV